MSEHGGPAWTTDNMALAAFLYLHFEDEEVIEEWIGRSCTWSFPNTEELRQLVQDYMFDKAQVSPREFMEMFSELRAGVAGQRRDRAHA